MSKVEALLELALDLEPTELEELLSRLAGQLADPPISQAWLDVARERSRRLATGESVGIPWQEVRERMYRRANGE
jgi:hypothetical protein